MSDIDIQYIATTTGLFFIGLKKNVFWYKILMDQFYIVFVTCEEVKMWDGVKYGRKNIAIRMKWPEPNKSEWNGRNPTNPNEMAGTQQIRICSCCESYLFLGVILRIYSTVVIQAFIWMRIRVIEFARMRIAMFLNFADQSYFFISVFYSVKPSLELRLSWFFFASNPPWYLPSKQMKIYYPGQLKKLFNCLFIPVNKYCCM